MNSNNMYSFELTTIDESHTFDQLIREFVVASDITAAYSKVISIIADLNNINTNYKWTLKSLENCYFVGIDGRNEHHECKCDCDDAECDCV